MSRFLLKNSTELAACLEAVTGGYIIANQPKGLILFTCMDYDADAVAKALQRVTPIYVYNA